MTLKFDCTGKGCALISVSDNGNPIKLAVKTYRKSDKSQIDDAIKNTIFFS